MDNEDLGNGLIDFLQDALNSTLMADANSMESLESTLLEYGGSEPLCFRVKDADGRDCVMEVPKLAISPLPLLRIQEAEYEVEGELETSTVSESVLKDMENVEDVGKLPPSLAKRQRLLAETKGLSETERVKMLVRNGDPDALAKRMRFKSTGSTSSNATSNSFKVKMKIKMAQSDMPAGLTNLLQVLSTNMKPK
ncbi:MAG: DUF2589 domain-containing protein [Bacteroidales bacterium]|jgi:hypothetical protein|nr:DUF2589 domain-containing protein [Bacteroidales bacterium]MBR4452916.1 DUF2589 domain-containing protein [Bacteroidales bacterium]MCR5554924.1 DUF2589 domain-containing protein [Bacteroidales bacterium]